MANIRFLYTFDFDAATITASSAATGLPAANVVDDLVNKAWRTTAASSEWIKFDLGSAKQIKEVGIFGHNLTAAVTVTLQANATDSWGAPSFSQAFTFNSRNLILFIDQIYRWWRITLSGGSLGYYQIGRICAGIYVEPVRNYLVNWTKDFVDPSIKVALEGTVQQAVRKLTKYYEYALPFQNVPAADQTNYETMFESVGITEPCVVTPDPTNSPNQTIYAKLIGSLQQAKKVTGLSDFTLVFREIV